MWTLATLETVLATRWPGVRVHSARPLTGGVSATTTRLELTLADGRPRVCVLRELATARLRREHALLEVLAGSSVPVARSLGLVELPEGRHGLLAAWIEGEPVFERTSASRAVERSAAVLAAIHDTAVDLELPAPAGARPLRRDLDVAAPSWWREAHELLAERWPWRDENDDVLVHGDFWAGNLLWRDGELEAVIDWEDAGRGSPLWDLAVARFELMWLLGPDAVERLTRAYRRHRAVDTRTLALWDLCAALRADDADIDAWAPGYAARGRPDITAATMRARQRHVVREALATVR